MSLAGKVALVTAGSAGLGAAIAKCLAREAHMRVVINYHANSERAQALLEDLRSSNLLDSPKENGTVVERFIAIKADMEDRKAVQQLVEETYATMGRLDVVVSNAGWTQMRDFMNLDDNVEESDWDRCFAVNVKSHLWLFHAAQPYLNEARGAFISTASVAGIKPSGSSVVCQTKPPCYLEAALTIFTKPYAVTKAALIHLAKCLAVIAAPNIRVNSVAPGILLTDWGLSFPQARLDSAKQSNLLKRFATVEDVAEQVKLFAESQSINGQNAVIDAGFSL